MMIPLDLSGPVEVWVIMIVLIHYVLSASSRALRLQLGEKGVAFELRPERAWERRSEFLRLNPAGELPVMVEDEGVVAGAMPCLEFVEETHPEPPLLGRDSRQRAEVRRLMHWFLAKFEAEVTIPVVGEKLVKRISGGGPPNSRAISAGRQNIHMHLDYIAWLMDRRRWLSGESMTLADIVAAAQLSVLDYAGEVPWTKHPEAKDWYARIKSRPTFRPLLAETIPGILPPKHYTDLDF